MQALVSTSTSSSIRWWQCAMLMVPSTAKPFASTTTSGKGCVLVLSSPDHLSDSCRFYSSSQDICIWIKKKAKLILAGDSRKSHSTHFTLKENGRKILRGMGHLCFQLQECHLAESLMASKRDIAKGQYVPDMSALANAIIGVGDPE